MAETLQLFEIRHWVALLAIFSINVAIVRFRLNRYRKLHFFFRYGLVVLLVASEVAWHSWKLSLGQWSLQTMLPLELCNIMTYISILALITKNEKFYPLCYFFGINGGLATLTTPLDASSFPNFIFVQTMTNHGALIATGVYLVAVEKYRPFFKDVLRSFLALNIYGLVVFIVNVKIGSNYFFLIEKPEIPSLLDLLPSWPWYIFYGDAIIFLLLLIFYFPFAIRQRFLQQNRKT